MFGISRRIVQAFFMLTMAFVFYQITLFALEKYSKQNTEKEEWNVIQKYRNEKVCNNLFKDFDFPDEVKREYKAFEKTVKEVRKKELVEGHIGELVGQQKFYYHLSRVKSVKTICEIGFNCGHSAFMWLVGSKAKLYSFDLGEHKYVQSMADYFTEKFPGRFNIIYGNSENTVPEFIETHPDLKCDILSVDGAHVYRMAKTDMLNFQKLASKTGNILILDDHPSKMFQNIARAWKEMLEKNVIESFLECGYEPDFKRGFSAGSYLNKDVQ